MVGRTYMFGRVHTPITAARESLSRPHAQNKQTLLELRPKNEALRRLHPLTCDVSWVSLHKQPSERPALFKVYVPMPGSLNSFNPHYMIKIMIMNFIVIFHQNTRMFAL